MMSGTTATTTPTPIFFSKTTTSSRCIFYLPFAQRKQTRALCVAQFSRFRSLKFAFDFCPWQSLSPRLFPRGRRVSHIQDLGYVRIANRACRTDFRFDLRTQADAAVG
jgi:hypothetical protein